MTITALRAVTAVLATAGMLLAGCTSDADRAAIDAPPPSAGPTANGVETLTAGQILERAKTALEQARSFRLSGSQVERKVLILAELHLVGENFAGTVTLPDAPAGTAAAAILWVGGRQYLKPDANYWSMLVGDQRAPAAMRNAGGRWVTFAPRGRSFGAVFGTAGLIGDLGQLQSLSKGAPSEVDGLPVFTLGEVHGLVRVATVGAPYPVQWNSPSSGFKLTEIDAVAPEITAPPTDEIVDLAVLLGPEGGADA